MAGALEGGLGGEAWRKGPWTAEEDKLLVEYVNLHGEGRWNSVAKITWLKRNGKSCRLRWVNYLRPGLKKGQITPEEESLILELHAKWGNRWSTIARSLPGRTDNEIKNYWRTHFKKTGKPSKAGEKAKSRAMRRQEQWQLLQRQEPLIETALDDMPRMDEIPVTYPQATQETVLMNHTCLDPCLSPLYNGEVPLIEAPSEEELLLWNDLWNMDDFDMCTRSKSFL